MYRFVDLDAAVPRPANPRYHRSRRLLRCLLVSIHSTHMSEDPRRMRSSSKFAPVVRYAIARYCSLRPQCVQHTISLMSISTGLHVNTEKCGPPCTRALWLMGCITILSLTIFGNVVWISVYRDSQSALAWHICKKDHSTNYDGYM